MASDHCKRDVSPRPSRFPRLDLRQATVALAKKCEHLKRIVTLQARDSSRNSPGYGFPSERSPLLSRSGSQTSVVGRSTVAQRLTGWSKSLARDAWSFATSVEGQGIFKCSIAYALGVGAALVPALTAVLGPQRGKHMVPVVIVCFHPARSQGSMYEAVVLFWIGFIYAAAVCFASMGVAILFGQILDAITVGHIIILIVFCGGGLGVVGWVRHRWPTILVGVNCSLAALSIIVILTEEGAIQATQFSQEMVLSILETSIAGVIITAVVSFLICPISARKELRQNMIRITDSYAVMLAMITTGFLTGSEEELLEQPFFDASEKHKSILLSMKANLADAKYEHYVWGTEREYHLEAKLVKCMQRLGQNIGGLRSAAATQFIPSIQPPVTADPKPRTLSFSAASRASGTLSNFQRAEIQRSLTLTGENSEEESIEEDLSDSSSQAFSDETRNLPAADLTAEIFERFIAQFGSSMKSLAFTLTQILDELPYGPAPSFHITLNPQFKTGLADALHLYSSARREALHLLYKDHELDQTSSTETEADFEEVAASCGYFSFSLQDLAEEMRTYLDLLDDLKQEVDRSRRSWNWISFWRRRRRPSTDSREADLERDSLSGVSDESDGTDLPDELPALTEGKETSAFGSGQVAQQAPYNTRLWRALRFFRKDDVKYAVKVGVGATLYALPAFLVSTRPFWTYYHGEWGLLSYMLVCSMTMGSFNTMGWERILGTFIGALEATFVWIVSKRNRVAIAALSWIMCLYPFYLIVAKDRGPMGRFILLTYNLSALYAYSLSISNVDNPEDEGGMDPIITQISLHRVGAVTTGVIWALIVNRVLWPISARLKFKDGLSLLWLRMGLIWKRDPLAILLDGESPNAYLDIREEFQLQKFFAELEILRVAATTEFELRGPFPAKSYGRILDSTGKMLDSFHAMNVIIMKDPTASKGEEDILRCTMEERARLCSRISHLFQVLASSLKLEFPLNDALPNTEHARDILLAKVFAFRRDDKASEGTTDANFALLYAYALVTGQLSRELQAIELEVEKLFGVLDEDLLKFH